MEKMEYQNILNVLSITAISCLIVFCLCVIGIGIVYHQRDKAFEKSQLEYKKRTIEFEKSQIEYRKRMIELGQEP